MKYYLIAGEKSGDLHGGNLIRALKKHDPSGHFRGFGGNEMEQAGMEVRLNYQEMALMGFVKIALSMHKIQRWKKLCQQDFMEFQPDVIILIDYGGFNLEVAKFAYAKGFRVFYYIAPKVWAWKVWRAWQLKANVHRMFCILPFEKAFFRKFDWEVDYVGNPVLDAVKAFVPNPEFLELNSLAGKKYVALLPGSRRQELKRLGPLLASLAKKFPDFDFVVAAIRELDPSLYDCFKGMANVSFAYDSTYDLLTHAHAAVVTSGTATLETGLFQVPQTVVYKASTIEFTLAKWLVKVQHISLVNLIADKAVVRELIQKEATEEKVGNELGRLFHDIPYREAMLKDYDEIYRLLDIGSASENAAQKMWGYLQA